MRLFVYTIFALSLILFSPIILPGQTPRSLVLRGIDGEIIKDYKLRYLDSLTFRITPPIMTVWNKLAEPDTIQYANIDSITINLPSTITTNTLSDIELAALFSGVNVKTNGPKLRTEHNPLVSHRFGADPFAMEYDGRLYVYMTNDEMLYDNGKLISNNYGSINKITCISTDDMVNWTDHGPMAIAGSSGVAKWAGNSWAPTACYKKINRKDKFFLYFANNANGIGVVTADTPYGPWKDPNGKALINRSTANCQDVVWLFDPAVLVDDDGTGYLYFGGGNTEQEKVDPGTARVVRLGENMTSLASDPVRINPPYLFENAGINKIGDTYVYSYCTNWSCPDPGAANLAYMTSSNPMGPFTYKGGFFKNPGFFFGDWGNNHHAICKFKGTYYLFYHSLLLQKSMQLENLGYRSTHVDVVKINPGPVIMPVTGTKSGVRQLKYLDPYSVVEGETMAWQNGVTTEYISTSTRMYAKVTKPGSWIGLSKVDFKNGADGFTAMMSGNGSAGVMKICLDSPNGPAVGYVQFPPNRLLTEVRVLLNSTVTGIHDLFFVFSGESRLDYWSFF